ncbi:unnamed protein product [Didymodactylos carnosus]|uniref:Uncharacterized protein n=1 Tax=Didymodactylos carnosus TaxID=1234261 RepID=A0A8S2P4Y3_9BILA|nr:unnamed protein product [Didymodactylos carnosus]CAF4032436.1 unnamed protein product [Didymodactylos carnosus]
MIIQQINNNNYSENKSVSSHEENANTIPIYSLHHNHTTSSCNDPSHNHFHEPPPTTSTSSKNKRGNRKKLKDHIPAELLPGHRGSENIDDLVKYIESQSSATTAASTIKTDEKKKRNNKK